MPHDLGGTSSLDASTNFDVLDQQYEFDIL